MNNHVIDIPATDNPSSEPIPDEPDHTHSESDVLLPVRQEYPISGSPRNLTLCVRSEFSMALFIGMTVSLSLNTGSFHQEPANFIYLIFKTLFCIAGSVMRDCFNHHDNRIAHSTYNCIYLITLLIGFVISVEYMQSEGINNVSYIQMLVILVTFIDIMRLLGLVILYLFHSPPRDKTRKKIVIVTPDLAHPFRVNGKRVDIHEHSVCTICMIEYSEGGSIAVLPCSHHYHKQCIYKWFKTSATCPICRAV
jgi:hypothetical protein